MKLTKRLVASKMAEIFDPLGMLESYKIQWKLENQLLVPYGWDQVLPDEIDNHFKARCKELVDLPDMTWPRCVIPKDATDPNRVRLIGMADAAQNAAGSAVYASFECKGNAYSCQLLSAKSRLVARTIPRNELEGVRLMADMMSKTKAMLKWMTIEDHYYTDSTIAMCWCANTTIKLKMFVRSRVAEIRRNILGLAFRNIDEKIPLYHIGGDKNPADWLTKPSNLSPKDLVPEHQWFQGEDWMKVPSHKLPGMSYDELVISSSEKSDINGECYSEPIITSKSDAEVNDTGYVLLLQEGKMRGVSHGNPDDRVHCAGCQVHGNVCYGIHEWPRNYYHCSHCVCQIEDKQYREVNLSQINHETTFNDAVLRFGWIRGLRILSLAIKWVYQVYHECHQKGSLSDEVCAICKFKKDNPSEDSFQRLFDEVAVEGLLKEETKRLKTILSKKKLLEFHERNNILMYRSRLVHQFTEQDLEFSPVPFFDQNEIKEELPVIGADSALYLAYVNYIHFKVRKHAGID